MTVFTPTDRRKSVRNSYVIEVFVVVFALSLGVCHTTWSDLFLFSVDNAVASCPACVRISLCTLIFHYVVLTFSVFGPARLSAYKMNQACHLSEQIDAKRER